jgi:hypothetical protein
MLVDTLYSATIAYNALQVEFRPRLAWGIFIMEAEIRR